MSGQLCFYDPATGAIRLDLEGIVRENYGPGPSLPEEAKSRVTRALGAFLSLPVAARTPEDFSELVGSILADHLGEPHP